MNLLARLLPLVLPLFAVPAPARGADAEVAPATGPWRAWLDSPGGELPFGLELERAGDRHRAWILNGIERIEVPRVTLEDGVLGLHMDHYDSRITARVGEDGRRLDGEWEKRRGRDEWTRMAFHATAGEQPRFPLSVDGGLPGITREELIELGYEGLLEDAEEQRWQVRFSSSEEPAVLELRREPDGDGDETGAIVMGTFLTTTGDYRFLAGRLGVDGLHLSTFDGAHAFLFRGRVQWPGLRGDFWSRDTWHETWTAEWAPHAELPDAFGRTKWIDGTSLTHLTFPDLDGNLRSLGEPAFAGKARIVQVFGSWCPNCHDEAPFLAELHERYAKDGLSIVGLAFELTGDFERDAEQVRRYRDRHGIEFPLLLAGTADKERATAALGALDRVRSFPTTIFLRPEGSVARVHSGFAGPGAGDEHERLRSEFTDVVEGLLREPAADDAPFWKWLRAGPFALLEPLGGAKLEFHEEDGRRVVRRVGRDRRGAPGDVVLPVELNYATVRFGGANWHLDTGARVLLDPLDFGRRIFPQEDGPTPLLTRKKRPLSQELLLAALEHEDPLVRREGLFALAQLRSEEGARGFPEVLPWLSDEELETELRVAAAWAVGLTFDRRAVDDLVACLDHPYAPLRREAARSLARMSPHVLDLRERLKDRPADPDPLVRLAIEAALR